MDLCKSTFVLLKCGRNLYEALGRNKERTHEELGTLMDYHAVMRNESKLHSG